MRIWGKVTFLQGEIIIPARQVVIFLASFVERVLFSINKKESTFYDLWFWRYSSFQIWSFSFLNLVYVRVAIELRERKWSEYV